MIMNELLQGPIYYTRVRICSIRLVIPYNSTNAMQNDTFDCVCEQQRYHAFPFLLYPMMLNIPLTNTVVIMNQSLNLFGIDLERATGGAESGATMGPSVDELVASDALTFVTICPIIVEPSRFRLWHKLGSDERRIYQQHSVQHLRGNEHWPLQRLKEDTTLLFEFSVQLRLCWTMKPTVAND